MFRNTHHRIYAAAVLIAILCFPLSAAAASSLDFSFTVPIMDTVGSSPLNYGDTVQGSVQINSGDYLTTVHETEYFLGAPLNLDVEIYYGSNSWGWASSPGGWSLGPATGPKDTAVGLAVIDNLLLPSGYMSELPGYVTPSMFPNLPPAGSLVDIIVLTVLEDPGLSLPTERSLGIGLVYNAADGVVTGSGLASINATNLYDALIYGEFLTEESEVSLTGGDNILLWEASGPIGAVPVPAAIWLLGSGLFGLIGFSKRRSA